ncbi:YgiW/YdeI family stress tolerance OB fold protein [Campylobacter fetus]|uniref:NirD/YgiW/YdeI family stress tolerance protein n=1 Tax=Campylobacter fetus subsp. testudinum TaxID=1507806 RepID=A0AAX0HC47_CAMFE|nr:NirD/YgiW/YdeI family stress tolerance protein [Campylobacter fetus]AGZ81599.1 bacterial OB fold (BOF) protein [Campylobacter fetus subsp. testudinum 03-427]AJB45341.1 hypothetical protein CR44_03720 [Campylobacter fetus subsp. testudinum]ALV64759.1 bacterial OB fold (BOF) protein [Campylobacter fetus subsp. testudinum Sp3]AVK81007.1 hypothetical protein C6B32_03935 [Campylobacter fetus subsp. testudinum]EAI4321424.1 NirD/YgiW/YdeI family stress tolerance protein [Campylobacter fetus]
MKKILLSLVVAAIAFANSNNANGGFSGTQINKPANDRGGYTGGTYGVTTVSAALGARDDTLVNLTGKLTKQVQHDKYEFTDGKDTIIVEIDDDDWRGLVVGPNDTVSIYGKVDSDMFKKNEIDVKTITKVNQ